MGSAERLSLRRTAVEQDPVDVAEHPVRSEGAPGPSRPRWLLPRVALAAVAAGYLTAMLALVGWTLLPTVWGWSTYVVQSGSMAPAVEVGDVLVAMPAPERFEAGRIVVVQDPARPGQLLSHRILSVERDGSLITKGDANASADSTAVDQNEVVGMARLRVPLVGLPQQWLADRQYPALAAWLLLTCLAVVAAAGDPSRAVRTRPLAAGIDPYS